jgi:magnesium-transporting ATPase (P-type)
MMHLSIWASLFIALIYPVFFINAPSQELYGVAQQMYRVASFWFTFFFTIILVLLPRYLYLFVKQYFYPTDIDIVREMQKYNLDGLDDTPGTQSSATSTQGVTNNSESVELREVNTLYSGV